MNKFKYEYETIHAFVCGSFMDIDKQTNLMISEGWEVVESSFIALHIEIVAIRVMRREVPFDKY